jgi:hypothetical protein
MGKHALLSASSSHRWLYCTPSARLEETKDDNTSIFAAEGSAAHELSEHKLRQRLGIPSQKPISEFDSNELEYYSDVYVDFAMEIIDEVKARCKDPIILIEQKLDYSCFVPEGYGTGDLVIVADETLDIIDLKYGRGIVVSAVDNPQMKLYAIGALSLFEDLYDIKTVKMTICQPRLDSISTYEVSVEELLSWAETELKPKAELAIKGEGEFMAGEHCRFCKVKETCRARANSFLELAKYEFKSPPLLDDDEISEIIALSDRLSKWASDVYAYATDMAINHSKSWDGFKLVEGRSVRKYANESEVIKAVTDAGYTEIYKKSLLGITDMERLLGKKQFKEVLGDLIFKPNGKPTLVPSTDKRNEITLNNTAEADFKEEI